MSEAQRLEGSCLCGGVRYQARGPLELFARCHCVECRKQSGSEFAANATVAADGFHLASGEELLREFEWSPGEARVFCGRCGSPILKRSAKRPGVVRLRLGCLDSAIEDRPLAHVFVSEKAPWTEIPDGLPQFEKLPELPS